MVMVEPPPSKFHVCAGGLIITKTTLIKSPEEKLAPGVLIPYFTLVDGIPVVGDYWNSLALAHGTIMVESKINTDGLGMAQLMEELTRMNYAEMQVVQRHCVWLWNKLMCADAMFQVKLQIYKRTHRIKFITKQQMPAIRLKLWPTDEEIQTQYEFQCDRFRSVCLRAQVWPHLVKDEAAYVRVMQKIFSNKYGEPLQLHKTPSKKLSTFARQLSLYDRVTEKDAVILGKQLKSFGTMYGIPLSYDAECLIEHYFGDTEDNEAKAPARKIINALDRVQ